MRGETMGIVAVDLEQWEQSVAEGLHDTSVSNLLEVIRKQHEALVELVGQKAIEALALVEPE